METLPPKSWIIWRRGRLLYHLTPPKTEEFGLGWRPSKACKFKSKLYLPTFSDSRTQVFFILGEAVFSNTTRLYPKISEDVPNNSKVPKKIIMLHMDLHKSELLGKVSSFTHYSWTFRFSYYIVFFNLAYFWKVCQFRL